MGRDGPGRGGMGRGGDGAGRYRAVGVADATVLVERPPDVAAL
jgi:hypothetical protein